MSKTITDIVRDLGNAARLQAALTLSDAQLLEQFALQRNEAAFEALLHRHGPLVFGVCRRMLFDMRDTEDAFQATFLVLARKAGSITCRSLLSNWLYGVAFRVAARARKNALRRRVIERHDFDLNAVADAGRSVDPDLAPLLHEEVQRLPDKYRGPVVLCYLEGKTNEEAANQLQCPVGTVKTRLNKAREILRTRLARRGVALTAGLLAANTLTAAAPAALLDRTFQAALPFAACNAIVGGAASAQALTLSTGVLRTMLLRKLKIVAAAVVAVAVVAGAGGLAYRGLAVQPNAKDDKKADKPKEDKDAILGTWKCEKVEEEGKDASDTNDGKTFKSGPLIITSNKIVREGVFEMTYQLDPSAKPKAIDLDNGVGKSFSCVYSLEGNTLKICAPIEEGGNRPAEVATKEGSKTRMLILKREAKDNLSASAAQKEGADKKELKKLQGKWGLVSVTNDGKTAEEDELKDRFMAIKGETATALYKDKEHGTASLKIDPSKTPAHIDSTYEDGPAKGTTLKGIYKMEDDGLSICYGGRGKDRPTEFASKPGSGMMLFVLKKAK